MAQSPTQQDPSTAVTGVDAGAGVISLSVTGIGVLRSIDSTNTQFVSNYHLNFLGFIGVGTSEDFIEENNILFAIARRSVDGKSEYFSLNIGSDVEASLVAGATTAAGQTLDLKYSPKEAAAIKFGGPIVNPSLDAEIIVPPHRYYCNTIEKQKMSYDSLSSIGAVTQEGISVSATNTTGSIDFETTGRVITDVGGVTATGERENLDGEKFTAAASTTTVIIRGGY
tara:strand:+ start:174 stop:851 length:678 start_codon:yes stop_codon:yes gene_type:complete